MSFRFDVGAKARCAGRLIGNLRSDLIAAVVRHREAEDLSQQQLAEAIGISRSDLNAYLGGQKELTLRSASEIALALNKEVVIELRDASTGANGAHVPDEDLQLPAARQVKPREAITRSSSRAMRTFVMTSSINRDD